MFQIVLLQIHFAQVTISLEIPVTSACLIISFGVFLINLRQFKMNELKTDR